MRLGAPVFKGHGDPEAYAAAHTEKGYTAAFCPDGLEVGQTDNVRRCREAMKKANVIIAEVGAWCNVLTKDQNESKKLVAYVKERLALADELGALVCVNIVGSWDEKFWYGPCAENFGKDFFDYAVDVARDIIDAVKPKNTKMTFEIMPFLFLDSAGEYLRFMKAIDRKEVGVHFDPINCINSPRLFYNNTAFIESEFALLENSIDSLHLKDLDIRHDPPSVMFDEVLLGTGGIDYVSLLRQIGKLDANTPAMLEHLPDEESYDKAALAVRDFAAAAGVIIL